MGKELAFFEGKIIPVNSAKVGIMTHALHYGTAVFEGIRGNWNSSQNKNIMLAQQYKEVVTGYIISGLMTRLNKKMESGGTFYSPHHPVVK